MRSISLTVWVEYDGCRGVINLFRPTLDSNAHQFILSHTALTKSAASHRREHMAAPAASKKNTPIGFWSRSQVRF